VSRPRGVPAEYFGRHQAIPIALSAVTPVDVHAAERITISDSAAVVVARSMFRCAHFLVVRADVAEELLLGGVALIVPTIEG